MDVSLWVRAAGTAPLGYQWYFNGTNLLAGQTASNLTLVNVQQDQSGLYSVTVSNQFGTVTSQPAILNVFDACVGIHLYVGLNITGMVGRTYTLSYTTDINATNSWSPVVTNTFSNPLWFYLDLDSPFLPRRFYRVDLMR